MGIRLDTLQMSIRVSVVHTLVPHFVLWTTQPLAIVCVTFKIVHKCLASQASWARRT